jgi:hypothetical protein
MDYPHGLRVYVVICHGLTMFDCAGILTNMKVFNAFDTRAINFTLLGGSIYEYKYR